MDIDTIKSDQQYDRYLSHKLVSGNPLLFAVDSKHESLASLFSPETDMNVEDVQETNEDDPYSPYQRLIKDFDLSFAEFIQMANIRGADGKDLVSKVKTPAELTLQERKNIMKEFNTAVLDKAAKATTEVLQSKNVEVDAADEKLNDDQ